MGPNRRPQGRWKDLQQLLRNLRQPVALPPEAGPRARRRPGHLRNPLRRPGTGPDHQRPGPRQQRTLGHPGQHLPRLRSRLHGDSLRRRRRATESIFRVYDQEKWRTKTDDQGDRTAVTAAEGGTGTLTIADARGRVTERREYGGPVPTGSDYTRTLYEYTPGGQLRKMTGPDGAVWTYGYDLRGRQTTSTDPDKGTVTTTYNDLDQPLTITSALDGTSRALVTDYDELGRKTGTWDGVKDNAHQLTKFTYDSLAKGQPTAAIRYVGGTTGKIYSQSATGYDSLGRLKGTKTVIAASDPWSPPARRRPSPLPPPTTSTALSSRRQCPRWAACPPRRWSTITTTWAC